MKTKQSSEVELHKLLKRKPVQEQSQNLVFFDEEPLHERKTGKNDDRSNAELFKALHRDLFELILRADAGDREALEKFVNLVINLTSELNLLARRKTEFVSETARTYENWPVVASLLDVNRALQKDSEQLHFLKTELKLGADSFISVDRRRLIDFKNRWHRYVWYVLKAMRINKVLVPVLRENFKNWIRFHQVKYRLDKRQLLGRFYELEKHTVYVSEWANLCVDLPDKLTSDKAAIEQFWKPMKLAILDYWEMKDNEDAKQEAFAEVKSYDHKTATEGNLRDNALKQIKQALKTLAGK